MIAINDSYRIRCGEVGHWREPCFWVEEFAESMFYVGGHWRATTRRFTFEGMRRHLIATNCPETALQAFTEQGVKIAHGDNSKGTETIIHCGVQALAF